MSRKHGFTGWMLLSLSLAVLGCPEPEPAGVDASIRYDAARPDTAVDDATGTDTSVGQDSASGTDSATGTDTASGVDTASGTDSATGTDATTGDDAGSGADAACTSTCAQVGARRCNGNAVETCELVGSCRTWSTPAACDDGWSCSNGQCEQGCTDECSVADAKRCLDSNTAQTCGQWDSDACLDWGNAVECTGATPVCSSGTCKATCSSECTQVGALRCAGSIVEECGDPDSDSCLTWNAIETCVAPATCSAGACTDRCTDECGAVGARRCDGTGFSTCGNHDADSCLEWGSVVACPAGSTCSGGYCSSTCFDECAVIGVRECQGAGYAVCGQHDGDSCLEWGTAIACDVGTSCSNGYCSATCQNECATLNAVQCYGNGTRQCGNHDGDPCLEWSDVSACPAGYSCSNGACSPGCTNECTQNQRECASTTAYRTCATNFDSDTCWDWSPPQPCASGETCSAGQCASGCTDACPASTPATCYDGATTLSCVVAASGCREWAVNYCDAGKACQGTTCTTCTADAQEPNDTEDDATPIATVAGTPFQLNNLSICQPDVDWFRYTATGGQNILVEVTFTHALGDLDVSVFDPSGVLVAVGWSFTDNERAVINNTMAGEYLIAVFGWDKGRPYGDSASYGLKVSAVNCSDECHNEGARFCTEDNKRATCANVDADACLEASASALACPADTVCDPSSGSCVACESTCTLGDDACFRGNEFDCVQPTGHTCAFFDNTRACAANQGCFATTGNCTACAADAEEPNNTFGTATVLGAAGTLTNHTICAGDRDFYKLTLQAGRTLEARATFTGRDFESDGILDDGELAVRIYKADQSLHLTTLGGSDVPVSYTNTTGAATTVWVEVVSAYQAENLPLSTNTYTLTLVDRGCQNGCDIGGDTKCAGSNVQFCTDTNGDGCLEWRAAQTCTQLCQDVLGSPCDHMSCVAEQCLWPCTPDVYDAAAPNDDAQNATLLAAGGGAQNLTLCQGDLDWFKVQVATGQSIKVVAEGTIGSISLYGVTAEGVIVAEPKVDGAQTSIVMSNTAGTTQTLYFAVLTTEDDVAQYNIVSITAGACQNACEYVGFYYSCLNSTTRSLCDETGDGDICYEWDNGFDAACGSPTTVCLQGACVEPCTPDANEASTGNDSLQTATALANGTTSNLTLCIPDQDWFKITNVTLGSTITVSATVSTTLTQGDLDLVLYDPLGFPVDAANSTQSPETVSVSARAAGDYYLLVRLAAGTYAAYSLNLTRQ